MGVSDSYRKRKQDVTAGRRANQRQHMSWLEPSMFRSYMRIIYFPLQWEWMIAIWKEVATHIKLGEHKLGQEPITHIKCHDSNPHCSGVISRSSLCSRLHFFCISNIVTVILLVSVWHYLHCWVSSNHNSEKSNLTCQTGAQFKKWFGFSLKMF